MSTTKTYEPDAACIGVHPEFFDIPEFYPTALEVCKPCPVRLWCLQLVDPANSYYDGVAGGHVWQNGKPVDSERTDPPLKMYLASLPKELPTITIRRHVAEPDYFAVEALMNGHIHHSKLTADEKRIAVRKLIQEGKSYSEVLDITGVSKTIYVRILKGMKQ